MNSDLENIKGVGEKTTQKLNLISIHSINDLVNFSPNKYIDMKLPCSVFDEELGQFVILKGKIIKKSSLSKKNGKSFFYLTLGQEKHNVRLLFFNQPYIYDDFLIDETHKFFGKLSEDRKGRILTNPIFEKPNSKFQNVYTVYPTKGLLSQNKIKQTIKNCLSYFDRYSIIENQTVLGTKIEKMSKIYHQLHFPKSKNDGEYAKKILAIENTVEDIFNFKLQNQQSIKTRKILLEVPKDATSNFCDTIKQLKGFSLSESQLKAIEHINNNVGSNSTMNRLLTGDVGAGKTIVAFYLAYLSKLLGKQCAFLAPTQILAQQHFDSFKEIAKKADIKIALVLGSTSNIEKFEIQEKLLSGSIDVVFGTQSLLNDNLLFCCLQFAIFDEQQKFGVAQRKKLQTKAIEIDILSMSATPIPRTLALTKYNEIQISKIEKRTKNNIKTHVVTKQNKTKMFSYFAKQIKDNIKTIFVCPKIFDSENIETYSVEKLAKDLQNGAFADLDFDVLHGKQKDGQKNHIIKKLQTGEICCVLCTSIFEVGIDIPDLTNIVILNAENFGLSTLHQMRGRVGRNGQYAYCYLYTESQKEKALNRLLVLKNCDDGFEIAEQDLQNRGTGDFLGTCQSGKSDIVADQNLTVEIVVEAQRIANNLLENKTFVEDYRNKKIPKIDKNFDIISTN